MTAINYGDPEPRRDTIWRSHREVADPSGFWTPPLHYDEKRCGWTVFGHQPVPQWSEIPERSFPLTQV